MEDGGLANALAYLALFAFVPFGIACFMLLRAPLAAIVVLLSSFMFLPELVTLELPGVPALNKQDVAALACFFGMILRARGKLIASKPFRGPDVLVLLLFAGDVATSLTNKDEITHGITVLPGLSIHESISVMIGDTLHLLIPFVIGRALFTDARAIKQLLQALAIAGVIYTPLLFIELMMSPQLNLWIYGFHQHEFLQTMRAGGYRPMVFMPHGLVVGLFMCWSSIAAVVLFKAKKAILGFPSFVIAGWNFGFLVACKSLGAVVYTLVMAPILWFLKPKAIVGVCALLGVLVFFYPLLRALDVFPVEGSIELARSIAGGDRAQSLEYRFDMEKLITDHTKDRPWFGWGRFRRNMVFDDTTGRDVSVSDGQWVITYSQRGAFGYVCAFGMFLAPILFLRRRLKRIDDPGERLLLAGLCTILTVGYVDLLPNSLWNSFTVFLAGALWGATRVMSKPRDDDDDDVPPGAAP